MRWLRNIYWSIRAWSRPTVIAAEPTPNQREGWLAFKQYPMERACIMCGGPFWTVGKAEVCYKRDCYMKHKTGRGS